MGYSELKKIKNQFAYYYQGNFLDFLSEGFSSQKVSRRSYEPPLYIFSSGFPNYIKNRNKVNKTCIK